MESNGGGREERNKYKGIRRRKWGKWVSEIRVPGTRDRLWLGSFSTAEGAAMAHDVAYFCLHRPSSDLESCLNFPQLLSLPSFASLTSPSSIQRAASDAGMAIDASFSLTAPQGTAPSPVVDEPLTISVYDYDLDDHSPL
ncbi:PREDICTED: ethylene-responsive transcription factor ERF020 [Tarenaya hassleriana]|uniref:ethylene-responsive transcription factor ERF020 n=1 Tax=Tarenaya hassleriana TaxID=28532 RepID=UPI00053C6E2D|nr:PREDICTED: ethylene-responsive transcription factor ERF020 [Tarenaya hassleriana]